MDSRRPEGSDGARLDRLWQTLDSARQRDTLRSLSLSEVVSHFSQQGREVTLDDLSLLHRWLARRSGSFATPRWLSAFVATLLASRRVHTILDPCAGRGVFAAEVAAGVDTERFDAVTQIPEAEAIRGLLGNATYRLHTGEWDVVQPSLLPSYDAIVCAPPVERPKTVDMETTHGTVQVRDDPSLILLLRLASRLSPKGIMLWVVPPRFVWETGRLSVRRNLGRLGLHLRALLELPADTYAPVTLRFSLALIDHQEHARLYVSEIPEDEDGQQQLAERIRRSRQGPTPAQGRLVDPDRYRGLEEQAALEAVSRMAQAANIQPIPLAEAAYSVQRVRSASPEGLEEQPNTVYLPEMALVPATTSQSQLPPRLRSYYQIVLRPEVALAEYVVAQLSSPLGRLWRQGLMRGATIPKIDLSDLNQVALYLPPLRKQRRTAEVLARLRSLQADLAGLESQLWESEDGLEHVRSALETINHDDLFAEWIETLPYPLAAILRTYRVADDTNEKRCRRLGHFFEALAEFVATVHISAWRGRSGVWEERRAELGHILEKAGLSWEKPSFGLWLAVVQNLSKQTRALLAKPDTGVPCVRWYGTLEARPVEVISSRALVEILTRTCHFRNTWLGHGGEPTEEEWGERLTELDKELGAFRTCVGRTFVDYRLLRVGSTDIRPGPVYDYRVHIAMGSNPQMETQRVTLADPMTKGGLCLYAPQSTSALPLVALVRIEETQQPASYFYNRAAADDLRYVSYQIAAHSDISTKADDVVALIGEFTGASADASH